MNEPLLRLIVGILALLVVGLLITIALIIRSTKHRDQKAEAAPPSKPAPSSGRLAERLDEDDADDPDEDVTRVGVPVAKAISKVAPKPASAGTKDKAKDAPASLAPEADLPKLSLDADGTDTGEWEFSESKALLLYEGDAGLEEPTGPHEVILTSAVAQTDRGAKRRRNEDAYLIDTTLQLFAVADGMGGYAGGDIASRLAVQQIRVAIESPGPLTGHEDRPRRGRELIAAVERANRAIFDEAQTTRDLHGMGTTVIAARFSHQKQRMYLAHVGDSRCYRFRDNKLQMLTRDHTLASRGVVGPMGGNICRAVGIGKDVKVDLVVDKPLPDDIYLLCSDGLPKMVKDDQIEQILRQHRETDQLDQVVDALVRAANASGGRDNITVVLVGIHDVSKLIKAQTRAWETRVEFGPS